jgi:peptide chain release factor 2
MRKQTSKYDSLGAIIEIHPGAGGTEAQDWALMLFGMYAKYCGRKGLSWKTILYEEGESGTMKAGAAKISAPGAYGLLKGERGVHRLVRISPFDKAKRRHTSFCSVSVVPDVGPTGPSTVDMSDVRVDVFRSGGHGGQNVNKVSTAVRMTHIPTGEVAKCDQERSKEMNFELCKEMLEAKLAQRAEDERRVVLGKETGSKTDNGWGMQIRSYVLCPYALVKDGRNGVRSTDAEGVLDGDIGAFLKAENKE